MSVIKDFNTGDIISDQVFTVETEGLFSKARQGTVTQFFSSSTQTGSATGKYYMDIFTSSQAVTDNTPEFSIAWGNYKGSGSYNSATGTGLATGAQNKEATPANAVWNQFINTVRSEGGSGYYSTAASISKMNRHGHQVPFFSLRNKSGDLPSVGVNGTGRYNIGQGMWMTLNRDRYKEGVDPTSLEMHFSSSRYGGTAGRNRYLKLVADTTTEYYNTFNGRGLRAYPLRSGSRVSASSPAYLYTGGDSVVPTTSGPQSSSAYGFIWPDVGIAFITQDAMYQSMSAEFGGTWITNTKHVDEIQFLNHIKYFKARSQNTRKSTYYFVRAFNNEYNHSTNATYYTNEGTSTPLRYDEFIDNPITYVTTIGLYNDYNELLAVAKLSKPFKKSQDRELLFRVKLDF